MKRSLWYRLFGLGAIPRAWRHRLEAETLVVADEGMPGWMVANNVRGPGKRFRRRREGFSAWLAVTRRRVVMYTFRRRQIHIPIDDPLMRHLRVGVPEPDTLSIAFDSGVFRNGWEGVIEFRMRTRAAVRFAEALNAAGAGSSGNAS